MRYTSQRNGYSLIEVLVAIAILMLAIIGPLTIAAKSLKSAQYARQQTTAFFLAQEGISIVNAIRNNDALAKRDTPSYAPWDWASPSGVFRECFDAPGCNLDVSNMNPNAIKTSIKDCSVSGACTLRFSATAQRARYNTQTGDSSPYTRIIKLTAVGNDEVVVTSTVEWQSNLFASGGSKQSVSLSTSLFNIHED